VWFIPLVQLTLDLMGSLLSLETKALLQALSLGQLLCPQRDPPSFPRPIRNPQQTKKSVIRFHLWESVYTLSEEVSTLKTTY